jgi:hypothetical protein
VLVNRLPVPLHLWAGLPFTLIALAYLAGNAQRRDPDTPADSAPGLPRPRPLR